MAGRPRKNVESVEVSHAPVNVSALAVKAGITPEMQAQLWLLAKGIAVSALDAALVYGGDNLGKVNFGSWNPMVISIGGLVLGQLRNLLHGGSVNADELLKALDTDMSPPAKLEVK